MRMRFWISLILVLSLFGHACNALAAWDGWEPVGPGISYQSFRLPGPVAVYVARMDRSNLNLTLESVVGSGALYSGTEQTSSMFQRNDGALNNWGLSDTYPTPTLGTRNHVIVAINGSFYGAGGVPQNGMITDGWYSKRFEEHGGSGFGWDLNRIPFIGECVYHVPTRQYITFASTGITQTISGINVVRTADNLILYTPQYDTNTQTMDAGIEVLVEMTRPTMIMPRPAYVSGYVRQIRTRIGSMQIPFDSVVLSATGTARTILENNAHEGDEIRFTQQINNEDCLPLVSGVSWTKTYASMGGSYEFLLNNQIVGSADPGATNLNPRTAIAFNDKYIFFIVVDGRWPGHSIGITINQLGLFARDALEAQWAINQDGGGSSTMVINGKVMNYPSDCNRHQVYLPYGASAPGPTQQSGEPKNAPSQLNPWASCERPVANGMLMVLVEPKVQSSKYVSGNIVQTTTITGLRLGPGTNYGLVSTLPARTNLTVVDDLNQLNGVQAKGSYWWKVSQPIANNQTLEGWVSQDAVMPVQ